MRRGRRQVSAYDTERKSSRPIAALRLATSDMVASHATMPFVSLGRGPMGRRIAGGKPTKTRRHKTVTSKRRPTSAAGPSRRSTTAARETEIARLSRERDEALEREKATAEVLRILSSSPGELEPVFNAMLENATRICEAKLGNLFLREGNCLRAVAVHGDSHYADHYRREPMVDISQNPGTPLDRVMKRKHVIHISDLRLDQSYLDGNRFIVALADTAGARTELVVPMLKEDELVGAIVIYRQMVRPFTDKQIQLVTNFAAQAVVAIENARLLSELRQRTADLAESLDQQMATSEVLRVISSSPGELEPVFQAMLENATRLCEAKFGTMYFREGDAFRAVAMHGAPTAYRESRLHALVIPGPGNTFGHILKTKHALQVEDAAADQGYSDRDPTRVSAVELGGIRTLLSVPMLKANEVIGAIAIYRQVVAPFTEKQVALVTGFASQAVIAIENTRLLNELRESLEQQTATAEVLRVISSSPGQLEPVFNAMLENATRICSAKFGVLLLAEGDTYRHVALYGAPVAFAEAQMRNPVVHVNPETTMGRVAKTKKPVQVTDIRADSAYTSDPERRGLLELAGARTMLNVPMLKDDVIVGQIAIFRQEVLPFTDKQVELLENFAAQAVIAIENTRLLGELRQSLEQQTATADVLKVISRSTFNLRTVLQTLVESAVELCDADKGLITRQKEGLLYRAEAYGFSKEFMDHVRDMPVEPERGSVQGRALLEGKVVHILDVQNDPEYTWAEPQRLGGFRTVLGVPMLREGVAIGVLGLARSEVRPFTDKQIELVTTFADQAVIAIENARLFEAEQERTRELARSLDDLRTAQDRLVQTQKLASLGQLTAGIAHEIKNPLNFVNNFSGLSVELLDELQEAVDSGAFDDDRRAEIAELTDTLRGNLHKIAQHGKRADSIVKNMLLHSREGSGERRPVDINALVEESLNLAYHGARAEQQGFTITLERSFDPKAGEADVFPQEITRVLLNLIGNGFYAATKRQGGADSNVYEPILTASTRSLGDRVEIGIRDNGTGILPEVKEQMFNPFFTTKPAGEGTGLGLSISHDIIVKQHAGAIEVDTNPGEFTEFRIILPRTAG
jgi:two-component system, NtrC family, sensor kinase